MTHHESRPQAPQAPTDATSSTTSAGPWLYACPRCCAQSTTPIYVGPEQQQQLRKQHRPGCKSTYKVLIGQVPLPAAQLQATSTPIARDQTSVLVLMLQRSEAAALLRAAVRSLNAAAEPDDLFLSNVRQQLETAAVLLTGSEEPTQAQYADFSGEKPRRLCNNCAQPASAHPVEITREGRRLVCVLRPSDQVTGRDVDIDDALGDLQDRTRSLATFTVTEAGRAALSESDVL
jgi:hypothetical protein